MSDTHRFFVAASDAICEQVRGTLDAAWGHPNDQAETCFLPASKLPHDASGRPLLAVDAPFCEYEAVQAMLPQLLASGAVQELTRSQYKTAAVRPDNLRP